MKRGVGILFLFVSSVALAQVNTRNFSKIDWEVQHLHAPTPEGLAQAIAQKYSSEGDKVRAIFRWIAENISYRVIPRYTARYHYIRDWQDSAEVWGDGEAMMASMVMQKRTAFCEGYAALFKALCTYAGLEAKVVKGFARINTSRFYTNHSWNAVRIDSSWHLLDVTWASGYILSPKDEFVKHFDERYFLTPPEQLIRTHHPEDIRWALLDRVPDVKEFSRSPYRYGNFIKYSIRSFSPAQGRLEAALGDTLRFELHVQNRERDQRIGADPFFDSTILSTPAAVFLQPSSDTDNKMIYEYVVTSAETQWLHLFYNNDIVLRYRLQVRNKAETSTSFRQEAH